MSSVTLMWQNLLVSIFQQTLSFQQRSKQVVLTSENVSVKLILQYKLAYKENLCNLDTFIYAHFESCLVML